MHKKIFSLALVLLAVGFNTEAQKKGVARYPSLFWEITGNGLSKPSYLFGTMHVSSKLAFHLSDSFYTALKNVDVVALELDPDVWQGQMARLNGLKDNYQAFIGNSGDEYLQENSFRFNGYADELKLALSSQPTVVNSLLYRTYKTREDFEEDTFLDLYIYQTGRKLGKRSAGVENYYQTEKLIMEAYTDMALEKKTQNPDNDGESRGNMEEKLQDAYRRGDLDLMDSLDLIMESSMVFREKFIYLRNAIQANSMDSIMRKNALFVGVGAAHLPGSRGVIELLRKKGYTLRPIRMQDRDAVQKEKINQLKVPVSFAVQQAEDGAYTVELPGTLIKQTEELQPLDRKQFADMANGAYYMVTRIKTHAAIIGQTEADMVKKVDSLLYENIPGKIISRKPLQRNGYAGFDVVNRTRRGDLQRNLIIITPFEVMIFKMSGSGDYVDGPEGAKYFSSINIKNSSELNRDYQPAEGGFSVRFPQQPSVGLNAGNADGLNRWEFEAVDAKTGDAYVVYRKSVYNVNFLDEDSFDLRLMEESFHDPDLFAKQVRRKPGSFKGYPSLDVKEQLKDSSYILARFLIQGPHYYLIASRSKNDSAAMAFINSFNLSPFQYKEPVVLTDTFMHFTVSTPVVPELDEDFRILIEKTGAKMEDRSQNEGTAGYWPKPRTGVFKSPATGEVIALSVQEYPKYYYVEDSLQFWKNELNDYLNRNDLYLARLDTVRQNGSISGFRFVLRDTGSSRTLVRQILFNHRYYYSMVTMGDTVSANGSFVNSFYNSFRPATGNGRKSIYLSRLDEFFSDLFSADTSVRKTARQSISNIYYGEKGIPMIVSAINKLSIADKDYFDSKTKLIAELGYIKDTLKHQLVGVLKKIYDQTADTSLFRNEVFKALARIKTKEAYSLLKELLLQDPPVFESSYEYTGLFSSLQDSLPLTRQLFPDILQLLPVSDYKDRIQSLLVSLVDSNLVTAADYESYFTKIYFDAKLELKKQLAKDEKIMLKESKKSDETGLSDYDLYSENQGINDYSVLLIPFYDKNPNVQKFFERLLISRDQSVQMNTAVLMMRYNKKVPDSVLNKLAASDKYRSSLYRLLETSGRTARFPATYKNQLELARSLMLEEKKFDKMDSVVYLYKQPTGYGGKTGMVYFFKYRAAKENGWKMGFSGLQPLDVSKVSSDDVLCRMTDKKLKPDEPMEEQFQKQLQRMLFSFHKSARIFYGYDEYSNRLRTAGSYED